MPPPPGVQSDFIHPPSRGNVYLVTGSILLGLMIAFYAVRLYTKITMRAFAWDDLSCSLGMSFTVAHFAFMVYNVVNRHLGVHEWDIPLADLLTDKNLIASMPSSLTALD